MMISLQSGSMIADAEVKGEKGSWGRIFALWFPSNRPLYFPFLFLPFSCVSLSATVQL